MTEPTDPWAQARARLVPEVSAALRTANRVEGLPIRAWPPDWQDRQDVSYFYRSGSVLVRDADAARLAEVLQAAPEQLVAEPPTLTTDSITRGVTRFTLDGVSDLDAAQDPTPRLVDYALDRLGHGVVAHEHAFEITPWVYCPATEPLPVVPPGTTDLARYLWPPATAGEAGTGVRLSVVDTGLLDDAEDWAPWLTGVQAGSAADVENPDTFDVATGMDVPDGYADPYAGHGTFIAGIVKCLAPATDVSVERMIGPSGFIVESDMVTQIRQALSRSPHIISLSAGGYTRHDIPPMALRELWDQHLGLQGGVVLVAAAGNNGSSRPFWPAAFDWAVGVGSMTRDGQSRSWFSNFGSWVDVYAPGEDMVNAYPRMKYMTFGDGSTPRGQERDTSAGIAQWSGTSFATPVVAALVAARVSRTGENARAAARSVIAAAAGQFKPGVGPRLFP